jgi:hypothetical protein
VSSIFFSVPKTNQPVGTTAGKNRIFPPSFCQFQPADSQIAYQQGLLHKFRGIFLIMVWSNHTLESQQKLGLIRFKPVTQLFPENAGFF